MTAQLVETIKSTLQSTDRPYMQGAWRPSFNEWNALFASGEAEVIGTIPTDIDGVYLRNTQNPVYQALGRYHPFDGDGMLHMAAIRNGQVSYRNRFIQTKGLGAELEAGRRLWAGLLEDPALSERPGWGAHGGIKDASSTDVVVHAGRALTTYYQCGEGYRLDPLTLQQQGIPPWSPLDGISAHCKVDERTGEMLFFNYSRHAPYMHYGVVDKDDQLVHYVPVPLPGPRLPHDMAYTEHFAILNDFPLHWDPELLKEGKHVVRFFKDQPSRFAIIPRRGQSSEIRWFEANPTFVLHFTNAYEDGDEIVLDGFYQGEPEPATPAAATQAASQRQQALLEQQRRRAQHRGVPTRGRAVAAHRGSLQGALTNRAARGKDGRTDRSGALLRRRPARRGFQPARRVGKTPQPGLCAGGRKTRGRAQGGGGPDGEQQAPGTHPPGNHRPRGSR